MSRSRQHSKKAGHEYWSRRPTSNRCGSTPGRDTKILTHRLERRESDRLVRAETVAAEQERVGFCPGCDWCDPVPFTEGVW